MVYFTGIKKTKHYISYHEKSFPWNEVVKEVIKAHKSIKKKSNKLEIETKNCYILCKINNNKLYIINGKRK